MSRGSRLSGEILLIGAAGQLGHQLTRELSTLGPLHCTTRAELDLADVESVRRTIRAVRPRLIVNAAAYTAVDRAESEEATALAVNALAPSAMAEEAARSGAALIHFSTDYVFDGTKNSPYVEEDAPNPRNAYGRTKLAGEQALLASGAAVLIFRIGWVYDVRGKNFLTTIRRLAAERQEVRVVDDQFGNPTWCGVVATAVGQMAALIRAYPERLTQAAGLYHLAGQDIASRAEFARAILAHLPVAGGSAVKLVPISTEELPAAAERPRQSALCSDAVAAAFGVRLPDWRDQLRLAIGQRVDRT